MVKKRSGRFDNGEFNLINLDDLNKINDCIVRGLVYNNQDYH